MQLLLWEETREEQLENELRSLKKDITNIRKGLFARHSELAKKYTDLLFEMETLKMAMIHGQKGEKIWTLK